MMELNFEGADFFRERLVLSILYKKSLSITRIRVDDSNPGLKDFELNFLEFLGIICHSSSVKIDRSATSLSYSPGNLNEGSYEFNCRGICISYFLEALIILSFLSKKTIDITFEGITFDQHSSHASVDLLNMFYSRISKMINPSNIFSLEVIKRSFSNDDPGIVKFHGTFNGGGQALNLQNLENFKSISIHLFSSNVSKSLPKMIFSYLKKNLESFCDRFSFYQTNFKSKDSGIHVLLIAESDKGVARFFESFVDSGPWEDVCKKYAMSFAKVLIKSGHIQGEFINTMSILFGVVSDNLSLGTVDQSLSKHLDLLVPELEKFGINLHVQKNKSLLSLSCLGQIPKIAI